MPAISTDNQKTYLTEVICLRAMDYGESDRILHLYSPDEGRISAIAKGAKRANSKLAGACERLNLSEVQLVKGRNLDLLVQYQPRQSFMGLRLDVLKLAYGMLFADLVYATDAANADSHDIFNLLKNYLGLLSEASPDSAIGLGLVFQKDFLQASGILPVLDACILTGDALEDITNAQTVYHCFSSELGGLTTPSRRQGYQTEAAKHHETVAVEWVNVSATTVALLDNPVDSQWTDEQRIKAQKFLRYYFRKMFEKDIQAYKLLFNILETFPTEPPP